MWFPIATDRAFRSHMTMTERGSWPLMLPVMMHPGCPFYSVPHPTSACATLPLSSRCTLGARSTQRPIPPVHVPLYRCPHGALWVSVHTGTCTTRTGTLRSGWRRATTQTRWATCWWDRHATPLRRRSTPRPSRSCCAPRGRNWPSSTTG